MSGLRGITGMTRDAMSAHVPERTLAAIDERIIVTFRAAAHSEASAATLTELRGLRLGEEGRTWLFPRHSKDIWLPRTSCMTSSHTNQRSQRCVLLRPAGFRATGLQRPSCSVMSMAMY